MLYLVNVDVCPLRTEAEAFGLNYCGVLGEVYHAFGQAQESERSEHTVSGLEFLRNGAEDVGLEVYHYFNFLVVLLARLDYHDERRAGLDGLLAVFGKVDGRYLRAVLRSLVAANLVCADSLAVNAARHFEG